MIDIVLIALCAVSAGADGWASDTFGHAKEKWWRTFLELPNGIPSHDTFGCIFGLLDPVEFEQAFSQWVTSVSQTLKGQIIALDGKSLRHSHDHHLGKNAIHMVSAWTTAQHLVLGQRKFDDKSNEISAFPELLQVLALEGGIVTMDALGCQTQIAETIVQRGAEYVLALKENQGKLYEDVKDLFAGADEVAFRDVPHESVREVTKDHGRREMRGCLVRICTEVRHEQTTVS